MLDIGSPLMDEVGLIQEAEDQPVSYTWDLTLKVKDDYEGEFYLTERDKRFLPDEEINEKIFRPLKILNIDFIDDYETSALSEIWATIIVPMGMWMKCLFPAREYVEVVLTRVPLETYSLEKKQDAEVQEFIYDALFHINEGNSFIGADFTTVSRTDLDNAYQPITVQLELLNRCVELVRKVTIGENARNCKPQDFIQNTLGYFTKDLEIDGEKAVESISVVEAHNKDKRDHINIKQGMNLIDVPNYVQNHCGGVYNSGINCFMKDKNIYVYPIYQTDRFDDEEKNLTVIKLTSNVFTQLEKTFRVDGKALYVIGLSDAVFSDITIAKRLADGNGVRYADSRKFMNGFVETKDNKAYAKRKEVNSEYKAVDLKDRDYVPLSNNDINSNPFRERSRLAVRNGGVYTFQWPNSKPELIYPGMPAKILYEENGEVKEMRGVVLKQETTVALIGNGLSADKHGTTTALTLFALPFEEE